MLSRILSLVRFLLSAIPTLLVLAVLGALAYWGHLHEWKLPKFVELWDAPAAAKEAKGEAKPEEETGPNFDKPIKFESAEAVTKTGLAFAEVQVRLMPEYVKAPGVVEYDHLHLAHLLRRQVGEVDVDDHILRPAGLQQHRDERALAEDDHPG